MTRLRTPIAKAARACTFADYGRRVAQNQISVTRGIELTRDDLVRRSVIHGLISRSEVSKDALGIAYLLDFDEYFAVELEQLLDFASADLVQLDGDWISVRTSGQLSIRHICAVFDGYLTRDRMH